MQIVDQLNGNFALSSEIHKLEARLWRRTRRDGMRVILLTSAGRGEGKSTTVAYLAVALGMHADRRILVVDLDFRDPCQNKRFFQVDVTRDLGMVLRGELPPEQAILRTAQPNVDLVVPSPEGEDPGLLLKTQELWNALACYRKGYDLILIDVPPMNPVADAAVLLPLADGVILVAMAGRTNRHELARARELCLGMEASILGLVVSNLQETMPEYNYYGDRYEYAPDLPSHRTSSSSWERETPAESVGVSDDSGAG